MRLFDTLHGNLIISSYRYDSTFNTATRMLINVVFTTLFTGLLLWSSAGYAAKKSDDSNGYSKYAKVIHVEPVIQRSVTSTPVRQCNYEKPERHYTDQRRKGSFGSTLIGGLIGGVIGNQFGGGSGKAALTFAGAIAGASIANSRTSTSKHRRDPYTRSHAHNDSHSHKQAIKRCKTTQRSQEIEHIEAYRVTYRYKGKTFVRTMDEHPGKRILIHLKVTPLDSQTEPALYHS
jgi:uncharacterized protein YcfJ